jgi:hypothetical protein
MHYLTLLVKISTFRDTSSMESPLHDHDAFLAKVAGLLKLQNLNIEAKIVASAKGRIEQTDYDNWDGGTAIHTIYLKVPTVSYSEIMLDVENIQKAILDKARFVLRTHQGDGIGSVVIDAEIPYDPDWRQKIERLPIAQLSGEIQKQRSLMIAVATGEPSIKSVNGEYMARQDTIRSSLAQHGMKDPNPYKDLWEWYGKWSSGDLPTYQSRRQYIGDLYVHLIERLKNGPLDSGAQIFEEPTGWVKVDQGVGEIRSQLEHASTEAQFQAVGLLCREAMISLAQTVYDPARHQTHDGVEPSKTDAKRMIEAYINKELPGSSNEVSRRHAKASLDLANDLQHKRTAHFRQAALCAEGTTSIVNMIAIISGRRDL